MRSGTFFCMARFHPVLNTSVPAPGGERAHHQQNKVRGPAEYEIGRPRRKIPQHPTAQRRAQRAHDPPQTVNPQRVGSRILRAA